MKPGKERAALKSKLIHYNREDVEVLVEMIRRLDAVPCREATSFSP